MRISNFQTKQKGGRYRISATVQWEDCDRPEYDLYFETPEEYGSGLRCDPHAFLVASAIPALHFGEKRVMVDGEICPDLRAGLSVALGWLHHWFHETERDPIRIDAKIRPGTYEPRTRDRAGFFFSGGIDSFATLRANRLAYPSEHPGFLRDAILVYGLELDRPESFSYVLHSLRNLEAATGVSLVPVFTNLYLEYRNEDAANDFGFWYREFMGPALASVGHALAARLTTVSISSDFDIPNQKAYGSSPLVDLNCSSGDLRVRQTGITLSRYRKTRLVADWKPALDHLRVCNQFHAYQAGRLNCGKCEKCMRTMLALTALGKLDKTEAFPIKELTAASVVERVDLDDRKIPVYEELIPDLIAQGRKDLATAIRATIEDYRRGKRAWTTRLRALDTRYLNGALRRAKRGLFRSGRG